jgi:hypothetical protein
MRENHGVVAKGAFAMTRSMFLRAGACLAILAATWSRAEEPAKAVKSEDLTKELDKDEKATKAKYNGKTITVEGKIVATEAKPDAAEQIILAGHNETDKMPIRVICFFPVDSGVAKKAEKGATIKIKGEFGAGSSVLTKTFEIYKCELVK